MREPAAVNKETKVALLYAALRDEALTRAPHDRLPSVRELCQTLGASRTTLDPVLDELEAHDIIYRKHGSGLFVSPKLFRKTIAIVINANWLSNRAHLSPIWGLLWGLFAQEAQRRSQIKDEYYCLHAVLSSSDIPLSEELIHLVKTNRLHGVLNIGVPHAAVHWLNLQGVPCVSLFTYGSWMVSLDYTEMIRLAVAHLAQKGCQRIGLWGSNHETVEDILMNQGGAFRYFLADHHLKYHPDLVKPLLSSDDKAETFEPLSAQQQGYLLVQDVFGKADALKPDGLVILDDMLTDGALVSLLNHGVKLGEDLQIVTHANAGTMAFFEYVQGISVIEFDPQVVVQQMFSMLDTLLSGTPLPQQHVSLLPRWRHRV